METTQSLSNRLLKFVKREDELLDITSSDKEVTFVKTAMGEMGSFNVQFDYHKSGIPARKVWKVTVNLIEDSTADDE